MNADFEKKMKNILFVCVENSCRSQMAEAFAHKHGGGVVHAYSSGSRPSGVVNPRAIEFMAEVGYDLTLHRSKPLEELQHIVFDYAITMGCGDECPWITATHRTDWGIDDPKHMPPDEFRRVRDTIEERVKNLIAALQ